MFFGWMMFMIIRKHARKRWQWAIATVLFIVPFEFATISALSLCWFAGCVIALFAEEIKLGLANRKTLYRLLAISIAVAVVRTRVIKDFYDFQLDVFVIASFALVLQLGRSDSPFKLRRIAVHTIRLLAGSSYALYAVHYSFIVFGLVRYPDLPRMSVCVVAAAAAELMAIVIYLLFDRHHKTVSQWLRAIIGSPARQRETA